MTNPYRAMCAELISNLQLILSYLESDECGTSDSEELIARARALLDQPEPEGLTDEELEVVASQFCDFYHAHMSSADEWRCSRSDMTTFARAVIAADRARMPTPQSESKGLTDEELLRTYGKAKRDHCYEGDLDDWPKKAELAATVTGLRAAIAADRARQRPPLLRDRQ